MRCNTTEPLVRSGRACQLSNLPDGRELLRLAQQQNCPRDHRFVTGDTCKQASISTRLRLVVEIDLHEQSNDASSQIKRAMPNVVILVTAAAVTLLLHAPAETVVALFAAIFAVCDLEVNTEVSHLVFRYLSGFIV